jgi:tyrosine-specific transport protein
LGRWGQIVSWFSFLLLMYALTAAYTSQASTLLGLWLGDIGIFLPVWLNSLIYIFAFGAFVYIGTSAVDGINKFLLSVKGLAFIGLTFLIAPHVSIEDLSRESSDFNYIWITFPLLITSFGFHTVLPSIRVYLHSDKRSLRNVIIVGTLIPLIAYLIWEVITLGTIPLYGPHSFDYIANNGGSVTELVQVYQASFHSTWLSTFATGFTNLAIATSFLGVTLGLFNFNQDSYNLTKNTMMHKIPVFIITFLPPFLFAVYYPNGFVMALGYASIFVVILLIMMPALMAWKVRNEKGKNTLRSKLYLLTIILIGVVIIGLQFVGDAGMLPKFH